MQSYLRCLVSTGRQKVRSVQAHLDVHDLGLVHPLDLLKLLPALRIPLPDAPVLVARDDVLVERAPRRDERLALRAVDRQDRLLRLALPLVLGADLEDPDRTRVPHPRFCDGQDPAIVGREIDTLDRRRDLPYFEALPGGDAP